MRSQNPGLSTLIAGLGRAGWGIQGRMLLKGRSAFRVGAPLAITPEGVRETIALVETCRPQNPRMGEGA